MDSLERVLRDVLERQFRGVQFEDVRIIEGIDHHDDRVLYVRVVFRSDKPLDTRARLGFVRKLRPRLREQGEDRFPIMSFVSSDDNGEGETLNA